VFAEAELRRVGGRARLLDIGCGAGRNAIPLARLGWSVLGVDLSRPMIAAAASRRMVHPLEFGRLDLVMAPMDRLPVQTGCIDAAVAHGIWNLARSGTEFRGAVREAARVLRPGGGLFVFTFSRHTLPPDTQVVLGESFVFSQFSGEPQCFLTEPQLLAELRAGGFVPDRDVPLRELNRRCSGTLSTTGTPVIYEAVFRRLE
jgi:SAM-dependent methyltransferase